MQGRDPLFDNNVIPGCGVDPRNLAQRVMAVCDVTLLLCDVICTVAMCFCFAMPMLSQVQWRLLAWHC